MFRPNDRVYLTNHMKFGAVVETIPAGYAAWAYLVRLSDERVVFVRDAAVRCPDHITTFTPRRSVREEKNSH